MQVDSTHIIVDEKQNPFVGYRSPIVGNHIDYSSSDEDTKEEKKMKQEEEKKREEGIHKLREEEKMREEEKKRIEGEHRKKLEDDFELKNRCKIVMQESTFLPNLKHVEIERQKVEFQHEANIPYATPTIIPIVVPKASPSVAKLLSIMFDDDDDYQKD